MTEYNYWHIIPGQLEDGEMCVYAKRTMDEAEAEFSEYHPDGVTPSGLNVRIMPLKVKYTDGREGIRYGFVTS